MFKQYLRQLLCQAGAWRSHWGAKHQLGPWIGGSMPSWGLTKSAKVLVEIRCNIIFEAVP